MKEKKHLYQTVEVYDFLEDLQGKKIIFGKWDGFRLGVSVALAIKPNVKIEKSLKDAIKKSNGAKQIGIGSEIDSVGGLSTAIKQLEDPCDDVMTRIEELGNWGLLQMKKDYMLDGYIDWEKIKKNIK